MIALDEARGDGLVAADVSGGTLGERRAAASGGTDIDRFSLFASASGEHSDGWIPVSSAQRGAADDALTLDAWNGSVRAETMLPGDTLISSRIGAYHESAQLGAGRRGLFRRRQDGERHRRASRKRGRSRLARAALDARCGSD